MLHSRNFVHMRYILSTKEEKKQQHIPKCLPNTNSYKDKSCPWYKAYKVQSVLMSCLFPLTV